MADLSCGLMRFSSSSNWGQRQVRPTFPRCLCWEHFNICALHACAYLGYKHLCNDKMHLTKTHKIGCVTSLPIMAGENCIALTHDVYEYPRSLDFNFMNIHKHLVLSN